MKEIIKDTGIVTLVCVIFAIMIIIFTPYPATNLIHQLFSTGGPAKAPVNYQELTETIIIKENLTYQSKIPSNQFDLILPRTGSDFPVIIWVHGGAYVGGQKEDVSIYANMLAAEGYAVVNMEYDLAPNTYYPGPLIQMTDLYSELEKIAGSYSLDLSNLIIGGDSAGGQIAAQFINIQLNKGYSQQVDLPQVIPVKDLKAAVLFCSPFALDQLATPNRELPIVDYFIKSVGWSYTGQADWAKSAVLTEADLLNVVTGNFPKTFITDGNTGSFEEQAKQFSQLIESQGTEVTTAFYPVKEARLTHEYQFDLTLPQSQATFEQLLKFLAGLDY